MKDGERLDGCKGNHRAVVVEHMDEPHDELRKIYFVQRACEKSLHDDAQNGLADMPIRVVE